MVNDLVVRSQNGKKAEAADYLVPTRRRAGADRGSGNGEEDEQSANVAGRRSRTPEGEQDP